MKMKKGLGIDRHRQLGQRLKECREALIEVAVLLPNIYGKTSKLGELATKPLQHLDALRCELDDQVWRDHPALADHDSVRIYYGPNTLEVEK